MRKHLFQIGLVSCFSIFMVLSIAFRYNPGFEIGRNFVSFSWDMVKVIPFAFILIGLFEVWIKRETVERHLGEESGVKGFIWAILLAGTTVGGLYVSLPVAYSVYHKGARLSVIFTYVSASAICRVPMTLFEASFLGVKFTLIRFTVSIPLVIISSIALGEYLSRKKYRLTEGK